MVAMGPGATHRFGWYRRREIADDRGSRGA